jgi:hypothetical protein
MLTDDKVIIIPVSSTNKTDRHDIAEILLKVELNTIKQTNKQYSFEIKLISMIIFAMRKHL